MKIYGHIHICSQCVFLGSNQWSVCPVSILPQGWGLPPDVFQANYSPTARVWPPHPHLHYVRTRSPVDFPINEQLCCAGCRALTHVNHFCFYLADCYYWVKVKRWSAHSFSDTVQGNYSAVLGQWSLLSGDNKCSWRWEKKPFQTNKHTFQFCW